MNADQLRQLQAPIKARYKDDPAAARHTFQARGTLGLAKDVPVGLTEIRLRFEVASTASDEQLATLMKLTERYCVIMQTLRQPPRVQASLVRLAA